MCCNWHAGGLPASMSLIWIRLLVGAMGTPVNSRMLGFQKVMSLGGLGDLGMGGVVGIRVGQDLGQGDRKELQKLSRLGADGVSVFGLVAGGGILLLSPGLPRGFTGRRSPAAGSSHDCCSSSARC